MTAFILPTEQIEAFCKKHHIQRLMLFGSVLRDDFGPESDIDVLVEFQGDARITLFDLIDMQDELAALLNRNIDLATPEGLSRYIRDNVVSRAQVVYDHAA